MNPLELELNLRPAGFCVTDVLKGDSATVNVRAIATTYDGEACSVVTECACPPEVANECRTHGIDLYTARNVLVHYSDIGKVSVWHNLDLPATALITGFGGFKKGDPVTVDQISGFSDFQLPKDLPCTGGVGFVAGQGWNRFACFDFRQDRGSSTDDTMSFGQQIAQSCTRLTFYEKHTVFRDATDKLFFRGWFTFPRVPIKLLRGLGIAQRCNSDLSDAEYRIIDWFNEVSIQAFIDQWKTNYSTKDLIGALESVKKNYLEQDFYGAICGLMPLVEGFVRRVCKESKQRMSAADLRTEILSIAICLNPASYGLLPESFVAYLKSFLHANFDATKPESITFSRNSVLHCAVDMKEFNQVRCVQLLLLFDHLYLLLRQYENVKPAAHPSSDPARNPTPDSPHPAMRSTPRESGGVR